MDSKKSLNIKYIAGQVCYFATFAAMMGYASVYLLYQGFSNATIGVILSLCNILTVFLQPALATFVDNHKNIEIRKIITTIVAVAVALSIALLVLPANQTMIFILIVSIFTLENTIQPLMNTLAFIFEKYDIKINYGLARGLGSVAYAVASIALGYIVEWFNPKLLPLCYVIFNSLLFVAVYLFVLPKDTKSIVSEEVNKTEENSTGLVAFATKYKKFLVFLLGFVFVYFAHTIITNFFIQIVTDVGGNSSDMGIAVFLGAILELPTMAYFNRLCEKVNCGTLIKISIILFLTKHALTYLASDMMWIYLAQVLQMGANALFIPASVHYVNCKIDQADITKGQSFVTLSMMVSGVFANLVGGILLDMISVSHVLLMGVGMSLIGAFIVCLAVEKV